MSKILNNSTITTYVHKMIELKKGFIINGQYYLKETMQPVPFNTVAHNVAAFTDSGRSLLSLDRTVKYYTQYNQGVMSTPKSRLCYDSKDDSITYTVIESNSYRFLCKFRELNNTCDLLKVVAIDTSDHAKLVSIIEKDTTINVCIAGSGVVSNIYIYNKEDLTLVTTNKLDDLNANASYSFDNYSEIYKNDSHIFSYKSGYGYNRYTCMNQLTNTRVSHDMNDVDLNFYDSSNYRNRFNFNNLYIKEENKFGVIHLAIEKRVSGICNFKGAYLIEYDTLQNNFIRTEYKLTIDEEVASAYPTGVYMTSESWISDVWYKTIEGKKYMILYLRDGFRPGLLSRAYIFEIAETPAVVEQESVLEVTEAEIIRTIKLIKVQEFPLGQTGNIIYYDDDPKLKFYNIRRAGAALSLINNIFCYEFDELKLEFVKTFNVDGEIKEFGFDKDRNLYVLWNNNEVSRYNERTVSNFNARFEHSLYEYAGEDISTNLIISTTNLEGEFLEKEITLDLKGNAKFTSNATKTITVKTSKSAEIKIPITITGAGSLSIFPKIKI